MLGAYGLNINIRINSSHHVSLDVIFLGRIDSAMLKFRFKLSTLLIAVALVAALLALIPLGWNTLTGFDRGMQIKFNRLVIGDSRQDSITDLGTPMSSQRVLSHQLRSHTEQLAKSKKSGSVEYLLWRNGIDWYYCIGLDADGTITFIFEGRS